MILMHLKNAYNAFLKCNEWGYNAGMETNDKVALEQKLKPGEKLCLPYLESLEMSAVAPH
jgi:hypothetical protein